MESTKPISTFSRCHQLGREITFDVVVGLFCFGRNEGSDQPLLALLQSNVPVETCSAPKVRVIRVRLSLIPHGKPKPT